MLRRLHRWVVFIVLGISIGLLKLLRVLAGGKVGGKDRRRVPTIGQFQLGKRRFRKVRCQ